MEDKLQGITYYTYIMLSLGVIFISPISRSLLVQGFSFIHRNYSFEQTIIVSLCL